MYVEGGTEQSQAVAMFRNRKQTSFAKERATIGRVLATLLEFLKLVDALVLVMETRLLPSRNHQLKGMSVRIFPDLALLVMVVHLEQ